MTEVRYAEFEDINCGRRYPFSESSTMEDTDGATFPDDVFVDAVLYPLNPSGPLRMSAFDPARGIVISDGSSEIAEGPLSAGMDTVNVFQGGRLAGRLVAGPGFDREVLSMRPRRFDGTAEFSPASECPVSFGGVTSVSFPSSGLSVSGWGQLVLAGKGRLAAMSSRRSDGEYDVFFNVDDPSDDGTDGDGDTYVREIHVVTSGKTLLRADPEGTNGAYLWLVNPDFSPSGDEKAGIDRDDVCSRAHMRDEVQVVRDTCVSEGGSCNPETPLEDMGEHFVIRGDGVWLYTYDLSDYLNPIRIEHVRGPSSRMQPVAPPAGRSRSVEEFDEEVMKLVAPPLQDGFGVEISIPGVGNA